MGQRFERATRTSLIRRIHTRFLRPQVHALPSRACLQSSRARTDRDDAVAVRVRRRLEFVGAGRIELQRLDQIHPRKLRSALGIHHGEARARRVRLLLIQIRDRARTQVHVLLDLLLERRRGLEILPLHAQLLLPLDQRQKIRCHGERHRLTRAMELLLAPPHR